MADEVLQGLSADPSQVPSKWNRQTVADGDWLQKKTLSPLSARDVYLAKAIDGSNSGLSYVSAKVNELSGKTLTLSGELNTTSSFLSGAIDNVSAVVTSVSADVQYVSAGVNGISSIFDNFYTNEFKTFSGKVETSAADLDTKINGVADDLAEEREKRIENDAELQAEIDALEAATDVIAVYGTYSGADNSFVNVSGALFHYPEHLTENDVIKILNDNSDTGQSGQTYWQATNVNSALETCTWNSIGKLDPYYSKAEINSMSSLIANTYLSATAVKNGNNIIITKTNNKPEITISTSADVEFTTVTSTGFSGTNISGLNKTASIDALINSAENGQKTFTGKNYIELFDIEDPSTPAYSYELDTSGAKVSFWVSADKSTNLPMYFTSSDSVPGTNTVVLRVNSNEAKRWLDIDEKLDKEVFDSWSGNTNSQFSGTSRSATIACNAEALGGVTSANIIGSAQSGKAAYNVLSAAKFTATNGSTTTTANLSGGFNLIAGQGIGISHTNGSTGITITAEGTTYTEGNYIDIDNTDNSINVEARLVNSAKSGASAQNYINENARYHIKKINFNSTDGTPTLLDFITSAGTTTTINYSAWKDQPNQSSAFLTVTNDSTNYIRYWSVASSLVLSAVSGKYIYDKYVNTNVQLTGNSTTSYSLSDGLNLVAGDGINLDYNSSNKKITFSVDSNDYIPYSAVEVKTMAGTDNCVGSLASGSNVLKIAATYAYKDENGDRIDTNYVKNSAMNNWITDTNSVFSGTCLSSVNAGSPFPMTGTNGTTAYTHGANCSSFYLSNSVGRAGSVVTFLNNALNFAAYPSTDVSASWYDIINAANAANSKTTCSAIRLSDVAFTHIHLDGFNDLNKISLIGVNYGSKDPLPVTLYSGSRQWNVNVPSGQIIELYKLTYENTESWFETNPISVWNTEQ